MFDALSQRYSHDQLHAAEAQRAAEAIAFAPVVFQVSRLMVKFGILDTLRNHRAGITFDELLGSTHLSRYALQVLLEASLSIGTVLYHDDKWFISKTGWFLLTDKMTRVNMDFNHDVNYMGLFHLEESLLNGKCEGLKVFGDWSTIYEGLSQLPPQVQHSWFAFDHFYSDCSFPQALDIVFAQHPASILDVGGNTGRWALQCVAHDPHVTVTIMDLPQQITLMQKAVAGAEGADRILGYGVNLLDPATTFPSPFDAIWMSQFLDCFSEEEVTGILSRAAVSMNHNTRLYIMETFWDRQQYETAAFCLTQTSLYFTALANGNSKMYHSSDMERCIARAGLCIEKIYDGLGMGHTIMQCKRCE